MTAKRGLPAGPCIRSGTMEERLIEIFGCFSSGDGIIDLDVGRGARQEYPEPAEATAARSASQGS